MWVYLCFPISEVRAFAPPMAAPCPSCGEQGAVDNIQSVYYVWAIEQTFDSETYTAKWLLREMAVRDEPCRLPTLIFTDRNRQCLCVWFVSRVLNHTSRLWRSPPLVRQIRAMQAIV